VNVGVISGGVTDNVVAPSAEARIMARLVSPPSEVLRTLERWAAGRATVELGAVVPPVRLGTLPGFPTSVVAYATDIPQLTNWGIPYLFGPGSIHHAHRDDEHVSVADLGAAVDSYERIATEALSGRG
jgi:acetylornithine deacetylase